MDPNWALTEFRILMNELEDAAGDECQAIACNVLDKFDALDGWLCAGGFLPDDWAANR